MSKSKVTVYTPRKVRTMDSGQPEAQAVAVVTHEKKEHTHEINNIIT